MTSATRRPNGVVAGLRLAAPEQPARGRGRPSRPGRPASRRGGIRARRSPGGPGRRRPARGAEQRLQLGLLVGADDVVAGMQPPALPAALVEIQARAGLLTEVRVAREHPRAPRPRPDRVRASQRQTVVPETSARRSPLDRLAVPAQPPTSATTAGRSAAGSSHASALTSAIWAGGKRPRPPRPRPLVQPRQPLLANRRRHLATIRSVQSNRAAISVSVRPSAASRTSLARITSRYAREYWPARRRSSRSSTSLIFRGLRRHHPRSSPRL